MRDGQGGVDGSRLLVRSSTETTLSVEIGGVSSRLTAMVSRRRAVSLLALGFGAGIAIACGRSPLDGEVSDGRAFGPSSSSRPGSGAGSTREAPSSSASGSLGGAADASAPPSPSDASPDQGAADVLDEPTGTLDASDARAPAADGGTCTICAGSCVEGRCVVTLATGQGSPYALAVDANNLYWTDEAGGRVLQQPLAGGPPLVLATGQTNPKFIAVDATRVYWTDDATVMAVPIGGGTRVTLASGQVGATGIAVDAHSVYWTNNAGGSVRQVPLGGGKLGTLAQGQSSPWALAINHSVASWTNDATFGLVAMVGLDGGTAVTFPAGGPTSAIYDPAGIAMDDANIYWAQNSYLGPVVRQPVDGGAPTTLTTENGPYGVAVDDDFVYFTAPNGGPQFAGAVEKVPKGGGARELLATTTLGQYPQAIAVDATSVYWANSGDGSIAKVTPK